MESLLDALDNFKEKRVIVIGDVMLDKYVIGTAKERVNPEKFGVLEIDVKDEDCRLGGAANVARNVVSLGASCYLLGQVGEDSDGEKIKELCDKNGIKRFFIHSGRKTIVKGRFFVDRDFILRADFGESDHDFQNYLLDMSKEQELEAALISEIDSCNLIIFSDYNKGVLRGGLARRIIDEEIRKNKRNILTLVDPKPPNIYRFLNCDIIRPNKKEAEDIAGIEDNGSNLGEIASSLAEKIRARYVAITCGGEGAFTYETERKCFDMVPTNKVKLSDPIGAGDTFAAALGLGMVSGLVFKNSVRLANYAAAIAVGKRWTSVTTADELREAIKWQEQE